jgi:hypothetical protein
VAVDFLHNTLRCANALIADMSLTKAGCLRSNHMPINLGAGIGAKAVACYQIKYMSKNDMPVEASVHTSKDSH